MGKLERTLATFGLAGVLAFGSGCAGKQYYEITPEEKSWQDAATTIQIADAGVTILGTILNDYNRTGGRELGPLLGKSDEKLGMAKTLYLSLSYMTWKYFPEWRKGISQATLITGLAPLAVNIAQFLIYPFRE